MRNFNFIIVAIMLTLYSCGKPSSLEYKDFISYIQDEDNGLKRSQELNGIVYDVQFVPAVLKNYQLNKKMGIQTKTSKELYFKYKLSLSSGKDILKSTINKFDEYNLQLQYLNNELQHDFYIVNEKDTTQCLMLVHEYIDGITPYITCNLIFPSPQKKQSKSDDFRLVYKDNLFSGETIYFQFENSQLQDLPKIQ